MPPEAISLLEGSCLKAAAVELEPDFDDTITDFSPPISDECTQKYHRRF